MHSSHNRVALTCSEVAAASVAAQAPGLGVVHMRASHGWVEGSSLYFDHLLDSGLFFLLLGGVVLTMRQSEELGKLYVLVGVHHGLEVFTSIDPLVLYSALDVIVLNNALAVFLASDDDLGFTELVGLLVVSLRQVLNGGQVRDGDSAVLLSDLLANPSVK